MTRIIYRHSLFLLLIAAGSTSSFKLRPFALRDGFVTPLGESKGCVSGRQKRLDRREKRNLKKKQEYEYRRKKWEERYGSLKALQATFKSGPRNLSPEQTRRLYHSLLPRSLLGLYEMGLMNPEELAPLAYKARIAAKQYARSRCVWTARFATAIFDQYRNLREKKRFGASSLTWEEIYQKYEAQIVREERLKENGKEKAKGLRRNEADFTMRVYLRILERSCETNQAFDRLFLKEPEDTSDYLEGIASQLESDVQSILLGPKENAKVMQRQRQLIKQKRRANAKEEKKKKRKINRKKNKPEEKSSRTRVNGVGTM